MTKLLKHIALLVFGTALTLGAAPGEAAADFGYICHLQYNPEHDSTYGDDGYIVVSVRENTDCSGQQTLVYFCTPGYQSTVCRPGWEMNIYNLQGMHVALHRHMLSGNRVFAFTHLGTPPSNTYGYKMTLYNEP